VTFKDQLATINASLPPPASTRDLTEELRRLTAISNRQRAPITVRADVTINFKDDTK